MQTEMSNRLLTGNMVLVKMHLYYLLSKDKTIRLFLHFHLNKIQNIKELTLEIFIAL